MKEGIPSWLEPLISGEIESEDMQIAKEVKDLKEARVAVMSGGQVDNGLKEYIENLDLGSRILLLTKNPA